MADLLPYLLGGALLTQVFYAAYYFLPLAWHPERAPDEVGERPVSVLVCARNELPNLRRLLPALLAQEYPEYEVLLIDDQSTDGTGGYVEALQREHPHLRLVTVRFTPEGLNPKKYALTLGVRAARHQNLLLTDADCLPRSPHWVRRMQAGFANGADVVLGYSPYRKEAGFLNVLIRYETLLTAIQYLSFAKRGQPYMGVGRNLAYTKACFYRNRGFASHIRSLGGDDDLFIRDAANHSRINFVIAPEAQTESIPKQTYQDWIIQKRRHLSAGRQYRFSDKFKVGLFILSNVLFYVIAATMLAEGTHLPILGMLFGARWLVLFSAYALVARRLREELPVLLLPVVDLVYFCHYAFLGVSVLLLKKIKWK